MNFADTIIKLALDKFKAQYNKVFEVNDCTICQIQPTYGTVLGFELTTKRDDDNVRIRIYLSYGPGNSLQNFRLEVDDTSGVGVIKDEVYVALGTIAFFYKENNPNIATTIPLCTVPNIIAVQIQTPDIIDPTEGTVIAGLYFNFIASPFTLLEGSDTHISSSWELSQDPNFDNKILQLNFSSDQLTSWSDPDYALTPDATYYVRVKYHSQKANDTEWSIPVMFKTDIETINNGGIQIIGPYDYQTSQFIGDSIAISGDGNWIMLGGSRSTENGNLNAGSVYTFKRVGNDWVSHEKLTEPVLTAYNQFGSSVALDYTGTRAVIGAKAADPNNLSNAGAAYVYVLSNDTWVLEATLVSSDSNYFDNNGFDVAINKTGDCIVVSAPGRSIESFASVGAAYVYKRTGTTWTEETRLDIPSDDIEQRAYFGNAVSIDNLGNRIAISAYGLDVTDGGGFVMVPDSGKVYIFKRNSSTQNWELEQTIAPDVSFSWLNFGYSLALSGTGDHLVVGGVLASAEGFARLYKFDEVLGWDASTYTNISVNSTISEDYFGYAVDIDETGSTILISAYANDSEDNAIIDQGSAHILTFDQQTNSYIETRTLLPSESKEYMYFGKVVALSKDGKVSLVGVENGNFEGTYNAGCAFIYY